MMMNYQVTQPVTVEPITLAEAKLHLRQMPCGDVEDSLINDAITAAREYCENATGLALGTQTITAYPNRFTPVMELPKGPVQNIELISCTTKDGEEIILNVGTDYIANFEIVPAQVIILRSQPTSLYPINPIKINYTAGYTGMGSARIPRLIKQAMHLLIGYWYENRGDGMIEKECDDATMRAVMRSLWANKVRWC